MGDVGETRQRAQLSLLDRIVVPIVIGVLAFAASLLAANISNNGAAENQRAQLEVERQKEDRARKYEVYLGFTEAVFAYSVPFRATIDCLRVQPSKAESCLATIKAAQEPRRELRNTFNKVVVFGSDQANQAGFRLYRSLVTFDDDQTSDTDTHHNRYLRRTCQGRSPFPRRMHRTPCRSLWGPTGPAWRAPRSRPMTRPIPTSSESCARSCPRSPDRAANAQGRRQVWAPVA